jgi:NitT/TauT family transport system substrate-binding protein
MADDQGRKHVSPHGPELLQPRRQVNVASLRQDLEFFRELGLIEKKDVSVDGVVDGSFAKAAVAKLGPYRPAN